MQLNGLLELLRQSGTYRQLVDDLRAQRPVTDQQLLRAARPFVAAALAEDLLRPVVFLTGRVDRAHNLAEQMPVWLPDRSVERFAEPSASFYERSPWTGVTIRSRLNTLARFAPPIGVAHPQADAPAVVVASAYALMQKTLPVREFRAGSRMLKVGAINNPDKLLRTWLQVGYMPASIVVEPGTFSRRGGILDIFPASASQPVRIEFFGDEIESLRTFSPSTQRSSDSTDQVVITPAREALPRFSPAVAEQLRDWFAAQPDPTEDVVSMQPDGEPLANGVAFPFSEFYLPYLYSYPASLLGYTPDDALIIVDDWGSLGDTMAEMEEQALANREDKVSSGQLPPDFPLPYFTWAELQDEVSTRQTLHLGSSYETPPDSTPVLGDLFSPGQRYGGQLRSLLDDLVGLYDESRPVIIAAAGAAAGRAVGRAGRLRAPRHRD